MKKIKPKIKLKELLRGITKDNLHKEVDWSKPVGKEFGANNKQ
jgi:antitoxin component of MazEF toxin-antitoxin module